MNNKLKMVLNCNKNRNFSALKNIFFCVFLAFFLQLIAKKTARKLQKKNTTLLFIKILLFLHFITVNIKYLFYEKD